MINENNIITKIINRFIWRLPLTTLKIISSELEVKKKIGIIKWQFPTLVAKTRVIRIY